MHCWGSGVQVAKINKSVQGLALSFLSFPPALKALKDRVLCLPGLAQFYPMVDCGHMLFFVCFQNTLMF